MEIKWKYAIQESKESFICYLTGIVMFISVFLIETYAGKEGYVGSKEYMETMGNMFLFTVFIYYCGWLCNTRQRNFVKWYKKTVKNGVKCEGEIVSIKQIAVYGDNHRRRKTNTYEITIKYYSLLNRKEVYYKENNIWFPEIDTTKRICCDVYELTKPVEQHDYDGELIQIKETGENKAEITMDINPFKLFSVVHKKYTTASFGNQVANNFAYKEL